MGSPDVVRIYGPAPTVQQGHEPVQGVDETGRLVCSFNVENGAFNFVLTETQ